MPKFTVEEIPKDGPSSESKSKLSPSPSTPTNLNESLKTKLSIRASRSNPQLNIHPLGPSAPVEEEVTCLSAKGISQVFDPQKIIFPMTLRKLAFWSLYSLLAVGMFYLFSSPAVAAGFYNFLASSNILLMVFILGIGPSIDIIAQLSTDYEYKSPGEDKDSIDEFDELDPELGLKEPDLEETRRLNHEKNKDIAIIIPCHNSSSYIKRTVEAAYFLYKHVIVIDNANEKSPPSPNLTHIAVKSVSNDVKYLYYPIGNKSLGIKIGCMVTRILNAQHGMNINKIINIDDDVILDPTFDSDDQHIIDSIKAVCYPVDPISIDGRDGDLIRLQQLEYRRADHINYFLSGFGGISYPHGAISLWDRKALEEDILPHHSLEFAAEDVQTGMIARTRLGHKLAFSKQPPVKTFAPNNILSFWKQRVHVWMLAKFKFSVDFFSQLFLSCPSHGSQFLGQKAVELYNFISIVADILRVPVLVLLSTTPGFWWKFLAAAGVNNIALFSWNYIKMREHPELQSSLPTLVKYNFYQVCQSGMSLVSLLRLILIDLPNSKQITGITKLVATEAITDEKIARILRRYNQPLIRIDSMRGSPDFFATPFSNTGSRESLSEAVRSEIGRVFSGDKSARKIILRSPLNATELESPVLSRKASELSSHNRFFSYSEKASRTLTPGGSEYISACLLFANLEQSSPTKESPHVEKPQSHIRGTLFPITRNYSHRSDGVELVEVKPELNTSDSIKTLESEGDLHEREIIDVAPSISKPKEDAAVTGNSGSTPSPSTARSKNDEIFKVKTYKRSSSEDISILEATTALLSTQYRLRRTRSEPRNLNNLASASDTPLDFGLGTGSSPIVSRPQHKSPLRKTNSHKFSELRGDLCLLLNGILNTDYSKALSALPLESSDAIMRNRHLL